MRAPSDSPSTSSDGTSSPAKAKIDAVEQDPELAKPSSAPHKQTRVEQGTFAWRPFSLWRRLFFLEVDPLVSHGYRHTLQPSDVYMEPSVRTAKLAAHFEPAWEAQLKMPEPSLRRAVLAGNIPTLFWTAVLYGLAQALSLAGPILLQRIVNGIACQAYANNDYMSQAMGCEPKNNMYFYCIGLFLAPAFQSLAENHCNYHLYLMGTRMRNALMAAIYRKCLKLSNTAMQAESTGKVITLMSNDAQKLQDAAFAIHSIWASPALVVAILVLLWYQIGWATFVGLGIMLTLVPATGFLAAKLASLRRAQLGWTDKRVGLMSEVIAGIQMIKFYAWEAPFKAEVMRFRNNEATIMRKQAAWQGAFAMLLFMGPILVAIFAFGSYSAAGHVLSAANGYAALAYFSLLRFPMSFLPMLITMLVNALVAIQRIQGFLLRGESKLEQSEKQEGVVPGEVRVEGGEFAWDDAAERVILSNISFEAKPGTLTMIVGSVGSGKSSLLGALIGSMSRKAGTVTVGGKIAYVAQTSWIMNDTLQENVLMGSDMDADRYREALKVSQLGPDLRILPNGDVTEIGDRGVTLSGGQKQRVSVARAVYHDADVYLLDDPLSAVDSHVGKEMFEKCIRGALRNKTVLLVTNALQHLPHADNIVWMDNGVIRGQGSFTQLQEQGMNMAELSHMDEEEAAEVKGEEGAADGAEGEGSSAVAARDGRSSVDKRKSVEAGRQLDRNITLSRQAGGADADRNLTGIEGREEGNLSADVFKQYLVAGGGAWVVTSLIVLFTLEQGARAYTDRWVGIWFGDVYGKGVSPGWFYLGIYCALGVAYGIFTFMRTLDFMFMCVRAAVNLHNALLAHILRLPKSFFDTNPSGRIINRFSRDTDILDTALPQSLIQFAGCVAILLANLVVIAIATRWFAIALPFLFVVYILIQRYYIPTARELQRIESVTRSPIYSKFGEALNGVHTIRAYRKETLYTLVSDGLMERNASAYMTQKLTASWLAMRLDLLGLLILTGTGALCIQGGINPGLAGLAILYALDLTRYLKQGTNMASQSEAQFNSAERMMQYMQPALEPPAETTPEVLKTMPPDWPAAGAISVESITMRYRPEMPLVLRGVTFNIQAGEKVGLVGRTGSGKSSIFLALFRMVEPEGGRVVIDGIDTRDVGVRHLRSKMSIIPQDPFLYKGTVRRNLDPLEKHGDEDLWDVLEKVGLGPAIRALEAKMDHLVVDNGANFSLGQRQLFCLARAMLRHSRILMLDEATASMDLESDANIQTAIRFKFQECTMLTIAHRLNTIMDSDRVIVMEDGKVVENAEPDVLLEKDDGIFTGFVAQTGKSSARYLKGLATSAKHNRSQRSFAVNASAHTGARINSVFGTQDSLNQRLGVTAANGMTDSFNAATAPSEADMAAAEGAAQGGGNGVEPEGMLVPTLQLPAVAAAARMGGVGGASMGRERVASPRALAAVRESVELAEVVVEEKGAAAAGGKP